ncbi:hypothetical protein GCM10023350_03500 [Nocardioides endophyticus]|uniref:DUF11 domain-containing protein n=2 Tax=Nocardioides endophyticus TaxID=1353775 RepID=A0ABP8YAA1_9ACTN
MVMFLTLLLGLSTLALGFAAPAGAATVYEIDGEWAPGTPTTVAKGDVVTSEWRVNVNDDRPAPSNDPVDNVNFTVTIDNGQFKALPDLCKTGAAYTPPSSLSADKKTLVCNLGTVNQGTAVVVQAPIVADGTTGEQITASGSIAGLTDDLTPINIKNTFGMDMLWGQPSPLTVASPGGNPGDFDFDFEWTLFQDVGSDEGPQTITYNLTIPVADGSPLELGQRSNVAPYDQPCTPFVSPYGATGHPYSAGGTVDQRAPFVQTCTLVKTGPNTFRMTITGIDYSQTQVPTQDSKGNPLPADQVAVASGSIWLRIRDLQASTGVTLAASAPTYTSVTGQTDPDETANNTSSKTILFPGPWAHLWGGSPTRSTNWDNNIEVAPGATYMFGQTGDLRSTYGVVNPTDVLSDCTVLDNQYVDYRGVNVYSTPPGDPLGAPQPPGFGQLAWYVGNDPTLMAGNAGYNPDAFTGCNTNTGWVFTEPADLTTVKAVRWTGPASLLNGNGLNLRVYETIQTDAPIGQDVWTWGGYGLNGTWTYPGRGSSGVGQLTATPGERYPYTANGRDILHVIFAVPTIRKTGDRQVVRPGEPATFTLTYSANGSAGAVPPTVDDYRIIDTLPVGMTYVPGSAAPEPTITTNAGRQVLTWLLDDVPTNALQTLTYQAVAGTSVTPGQTLTNTATSDLRGEVSKPATAQVVVSSNGYTEISKTADTPFIPNLDGSGDGEGSWTVTMRSFDPLPQAYTDIIDILPWEGDQRGTDYDGSYKLKAVTIPAGSVGTVYYTTADPATLSDDPATPANGGANTPSAMWSTTFTPDATAVRVIGPVLAPGAVRQFQVHIQTDGASPLDEFVNRAQGRSQHTRLVTRTSAPMQMAPHYAANLKKYVQDAKGVWRDANDVTDYPAFKIGDTVKYRIVVTNIGQGTLTNIDVKDDKFPQGAFHVDSLAPGASQSHEYSMVIPGDAVGTLVNTACAEADTPADAGGLEPVINCDPAGRELVNYITTKVADPTSGTAVQAGQKIKYTIAVTQQGTVPADAVFTDDLADVLDDAKYNGDASATIGTVEYVDGKLLWTGTVPVGQVAHVTYTVTVKGVKKLGNRDIVNPVTSPGCVVLDGETVNCDTEHRVPKFDLMLTKKVLGSAVVKPGQAIRYSLVVANRGPEVAVAPIVLTDKLPRGLELVKAGGNGWKCTVRKAIDKVRCTRDRNLAAGKRAPKVVVVAKATKAAKGRLVNVAEVSAGGDTVRKNNHDVAAVTMGRPPALPSTGFRQMLRSWSF